MQLWVCAEAVPGAYQLWAVLDRPHQVFIQSKQHFVFRNIVFEKIFILLFIYLCNFLFRISNCQDQTILVKTDYSALQKEIPERISSTVNPPLCPEISPYLNAPEDDMAIFEDGVHRPVGCTARQRTAVIVPYRNRPDHLNLLLAHLNPILQRQQLEYQIFIVNQEGNTTFSRARLMNAGVKYLESRDYKWDCYIFHDVDLLIESAAGLYKCQKAYPRHLSASIDKYHYTVPWMGITGGAMAFTPEQYRTVNGFSNEYWGWGCEDDDMFVRVVHSCFHLEQADSQYYKYKMIIRRAQITTPCPRF